VNNSWHGGPTDRVNDGNGTAAMGRFHAAFRPDGGNPAVTHRAQTDPVAVTLVPPFPRRCDGPDTRRPGGAPGRFGTVEATMSTSGRPTGGAAGSLFVRLGPAQGAGASDAGTDAALLAAGFVTVTGVAGVRSGGWTGVARPISEALRSHSGSPAFGRS
jgi:hypothetical protein